MEVTLFGDQKSLAVAEPSQVGEARRTAVALAASIELGEAETSALAIVVTELAGNIVKHARGRGEILLRAVRTGGVEALAVDDGPGIADVSRALEDGYSTAGSPGTGLGAVRRMSDEFEIYSRPGVVTAVVARIHPKAHAPEARILDTGVVCLPAPGETVCGDAWALESREGRAIVMVADGLGHGPLAAEASLAAVRVFRSTSAQSPEEILSRMHPALRSTRGAAVGIAELDFEKEVLRFSGAGNISASVITPAWRRSLASVNGTVGHEMHRLMTFDCPWLPRAVLVMHSDGLGSRWNLDSHPGLAARDPAIIAGVLYRELSRRRDDVTVLVLRKAGGA